jgi:hypothetical protein
MMPPNTPKPPLPTHLPGSFILHIYTYTYAYLCNNIYMLEEPLLDDRLSHGTFGPGDAAACDVATSAAGAAVSFPSTASTTPPSTGSLPSPCSSTSSSKATATEVAVLRMAHLSRALSAVQEDAQSLAVPVAVRPAGGFGNSKAQVLCSSSPAVVAPPSLAVLSSAPPVASPSAEMLSANANVAPCPFTWRDWLRSRCVPYGFFPLSI